ncbi:secretory phospholipase A2 receptor-like [Lingula anatina]|uniref:Secretory phospholipase A2 receptor-like n=1 Tax=Lingula anatina TaxID=7574 RepID=A0A1S3JN76_LINAN|nr:secretory phospholipase A2 receptor-like [Lingula anatina]|eukprot:XP_013411822.1 secretory phospholipase A2 receptor-like [Lingula anatina]
MAGVTLCNTTGYKVTTLPVLLIAMLLLESVKSCNVAGSSCRNGTCYFVNTNAMKWQSALEHCKNTCNGRLAVVKDNYTQIFLHDLTSSEVWLGGREENLTDWWWIDQEGALTATTYTHWSGPQTSPNIEQQPDTYYEAKFQPAVVLMRVRNTSDTFPWVDREYLQTQNSGVICEADQKSQVCQGNHSFHWVQNNSRWTDIKDDVCVFINIPSERATWFEGQMSCKEAGGKLLKIDNDTVQKKVENRLNNNSGQLFYWIGLVHSVWRWVDDDSINLMFWRPIMYPPYHTGPACLALEGNASDVTRSWLMKDCSETLPYICEYPLATTMLSEPFTKIVTGNPAVTDGPLVTTANKSDEVNMTVSMNGTVSVGERTGTCDTLSPFRH